MSALGWCGRTESIRGSGESDGARSGVLAGGGCAHRAAAAVSSDELGCAAEADSDFGLDGDEDRNSQRRKYSHKEQGEDQAAFQHVSFRFLRCTGPRACAVLQ